MSNLKYFQNIIKEKRKNTNPLEFLEKVASWKPFGFYKYETHISRYPKSSRKLNLVDNITFEEDRNIPSNYEYDFSINFFDNFKNLFEKTPLTYLINFNNNENVDYSDCNFTVKNSYLSTTVGVSSENIFYSAYCYNNVKNIFNSFLITNNSEIIYNSSVVSDSFRVFYSKYIVNSSDIWFSSNLIGCSECLFCDGLQNKKYCINNKEYSKEEYMRLKQEKLSNKDKFFKYYKDINNKALNYGCTNSKGNAIYYCENLNNGLYFTRLKNGNNVFVGDGNDRSENFYDSFDVGVNSTDLYGCCSAGGGCSNLYFGIEIGGGSNIYYCYFLDNCNYCIGCIGLKNKNYCIFNKQYTKQEWEEQASKILGQMEKDNLLGEFFPGSLNPFYFNDSMAYLINDNYSQEKAEKDGYMWREDEIKVDIPEGVDVIKITPPARASLPPKLSGTEGEFVSDYQGYDSNGNWQINPEILKKVIKDEKGNIYRIVQMEYDFLMKHGLPLPEIHWLDRIKMGFKFK